MYCATSLNTAQLSLFTFQLILNNIVNKPYLGPKFVRKWRINCQGAIHTINYFGLYNM